jgi:hypothetical protein
MYRHLLFKMTSLFPISPHHFFKKFDPKKSFDKAIEYLKKLKDNKGDEDPNLNKYKIGIGLYLAACLGLYELKK